MILSLACDTILIISQEALFVIFTASAYSILPSIAGGLGFSFNKRKLVGSTLELDVDVLTSHFHIPIEEIFKSQNYLKRLIELMKTVAYDCRSDAEYEFFHYKGEPLQFCIKYETVYNEKYEILNNIPVKYHFFKYYNEATHSFYYRIILDPNSGLSFSCTAGDISMAFYNLNDFVNFGVICLYDGDADIIANYFKETSKYDVFTEYKYKEEIKNNGITWISRTDEIISEISSDDYRIIDFKCIVVKSVIRKCDNEEHHTKIINGIFFTISRKTGNVKYTIIPLG